VIEPLDVAAIQAQLAKAQAEMDASRAATDGAMARLERLSGG
jgi:outer membrane protein TolC